MPTTVPVLLDSLCNIIAPHTSSTLLKSISQWSNFFDSSLLVNDTQVHITTVEREIHVLISLQFVKQTNVTNL